jgi:signal recognition particle subunit SRP54
VSTPGQQIVKIVHDELVELLGGQQVDFNLSAIPSEVMLLGLHGSGKTTTSGKLARLWKEKGKKVLLVACDIRRPAAAEQLEVLAGQSGAGILKPEPGESVPDLGRRAFKHARENYYDIVLYDTGGRFQIDEDLVEELKALRAAVEPQNIVLVLDAAIGQESVNVAQTFHEAVGLTGLILTKLDGDARGGAALSVASVTGCPILRVGTGERAEDLDVFYPDRMASRILGMGDVVSLVEKVQDTLDVEEAGRMQEKLRRKEGLDLNDFLGQMRQLKKMGSMGKLLDMIPGVGAAMTGEMREKIANDSGGQMKKTEALILSMTPKERRYPKVLNASRRKRIARGSGMEVSDLNELLRSFRQAQQMAKKMKQMQKRLPKGGLFG